MVEKVLGVFEYPFFGFYGLFLWDLHSQFLEIFQVGMKSAYFFSVWCRIL